MSEKVEFIESYTKVEGGDYQWSDNHGELIRCKDCKHLFDGEFTDNCCDVLMEKAGWLKEISVKPDWFCADGERREENENSV